MALIIEHVSQPALGRGLVESEFGGYTSVIFESGAKMKFNDANRAFLKAVVLSDDEMRATEEKIRTVHLPPPKTRGKGRAAAKAPKARMTFESQAREFLVMFPNGFEDPRFVADERGRSGTTGAGGYKQRAIDEAARLFGATELTALLARGAFGEIVDRALKVIKFADNLTNWRFDQLPLKNLTAIEHEPFARALNDALYGEGPYAPRFDALVAAIGDKPTWSLATIIPALCAPTKHYFVRATIADAQAEILGMEPARKPVPDGAAYDRLLSMARRIELQLGEMALAPPHDLMDVYSFSWRTLHTAAVKTPKADASAALA